MSVSIKLTDIYEGGGSDDSDEEAQLTEKRVSSSPGGCISLDDGLVMEDGWISWPDGSEEYIPWTDGMAVRNFRYHIRRVRLMRTNIPTLLNVCFYLMLFLTAVFMSVGYNRAVTEVIPSNCDMDYYGNKQEEFPEPVRNFFKNTHHLTNLSENAVWYTGPWTLLPSRGAFCPITIGENAVLYDARDGQEVEGNNGATSQIGVIKYCFRHAHEGKHDEEAFAAIDAYNLEDFGVKSDLKSAWAVFSMQKNMLAVAIVFTWLAVYVGWSTIFTPGFAQTLEGTFYRSDKLYSRFKGSSAAAERVEEERAEEHRLEQEKKERARRGEEEEEEEDEEGGEGGEEEGSNGKKKKKKKKSRTNSITAVFSSFSKKVRTSLLPVGEDEREGDIQLQERYQGMERNDGVTGDGKERYLYDDSYGALVNRAATAHSMASGCLMVAAPLSLATFVTFTRSNFTDPDAYKSMFPLCDITVNVMDANYDGEKGLSMICGCAALTVVIFIWHCLMHYMFHRPAGPVKEQFHMPDLKHYREHYTQAQMTEFRRKDREWNQEKGRRVLRWVERTQEYRDFASEECIKESPEDYQAPPAWKALQEQDKIGHDPAFRQPKMGGSCCCQLKMSAMT